MPLSARMREVLGDLKLLRESGITLYCNEETRKLYREQHLLLLNEFATIAKEEDFLRSQAEPKGIEKP